MQTQRIVHLSDSHLPANERKKLYGYYPHHTLKKVVQAIAKLEPRPSAVVATGDISDDGASLSYTFFQQYLKPLGVPVFWLPGNHDEPAVMATSDTEQLSKQRAITLGDWQLILLNSQIVHESRGHIKKEQLDFLGSSLKQHPNAPSIIALHHTPCSPCVDSNCQLDNHKELLAFLKNHKQVKLVLAGHTHQAEKTSLDGFDVFTAPSTFAQVSHPNNTSALDPNDFFASHQLDGARVGFSVFDLKPDGSYAQLLHWLSAKQTAA